jgi:hypothetical protein
MIINVRGSSCKVTVIMMKERPTKCIFKVNHIFRISILLLHVSALQERIFREPKYPDEIVLMLRHKCRISEGKDWIPSVCWPLHFGEAQM